MLSQCRGMLPLSTSSQRSCEFLHARSRHVGRCGQRDTLQDPRRDPEAGSGHEKALAALVCCLWGGFHLVVNGPEDVWLCFRGSRLAYVSATIRIRDSAQQYLNFPWNSSLPRSARLREILLKPPNPESSETLEAVLVSRLTRRRSQAVQDFAVWQVWSLACRRGYKMQLSSIPSLRDQLLLSRSASPAFPRQSRWGLGLSCICSA